MLKREREKERNRNRGRGEGEEERKRGREGQREGRMKEDGWNDEFWGVSPFSSDLKQGCI